MRSRLLIAQLVALAAGCLVATAPALAVPTPVVHANSPTCDFLALPPVVDELGTAPFPPDELIASALNPQQFLPACIPTNSAAIIDEIVDITNLTIHTFPEVWYVADPETTITNVDGLVNGEEAFRIDAVGINLPLIAEVGGVLPGIFEPGETWTFIIQDFSNLLGISPAFLGSFGVPSPGGSPVAGGASSSSGSIVAIPEPATGALLAIGIALVALSRRRHTSA